jgi:hypothetical protein
VPAVLLDQLADARRSGGTFEPAWPAALDAALRGARPDEREEWAELLPAMIGTWERAFDRQPSDRLEQALFAVATSEDREPMPERPCARCGQEIPEDAHHAALYCSEDCRREAKTEATRLSKCAAA